MKQLHGDACEIPAAVAATSQGRCESLTRTSDVLPDNASIDSMRTFSHVLNIAWDYLEPHDARAIRASTRDGRLLYDSLSTSINWRLRTDKQNFLEPTPAQISGALAAAHQRGARHENLHLCIGEVHGANDGKAREEQILAVLSSVSGAAVKFMDLYGHPHLTPAVADAIAALAPQHLYVMYEEAPPAGLLRDANNFAAFQLLLKCMPALEVLDLLRIAHWPMCFLHSLQTGTRLVQLNIDFSELDGHTPTNADLQSCFDLICRSLPQLQILQLESTSHNQAHLGKHFPERPAACLLELGCLTALTALTRLSLDLEVCRHGENSWSLTHLPPDMRRRWCEVWAAQRRGLTMALRAMPRLTSLRLAGMQLHAAELAAMTALRTLTLFGLLLSPPPSSAIRHSDRVDSGSRQALLLLPPQTWRGQQGQLAVAPREATAAVRTRNGQTSHSRWQLPPLLHELRIALPSPTVLGALIAPPSLGLFGMIGPNHICFTPLDLDGGISDDGWPGGDWPGLVRLSAAAAHAFPAALQLLRGRLMQTGLSDRATLQVSAAGAGRVLHPPPLPIAAAVVAEAVRPTPAAAAAAAVEANGGGGAVLSRGASISAATPAVGHGSWLSCLSVLQLRALRLNYVFLNDLDVAALANNLTTVMELDLTSSVFSPAALPSLAALRRLELLELTWAAGTAAEAEPEGGAAEVDAPVDLGSWAEESVVSPALLGLAMAAPKLMAIKISQPPHHSAAAAAIFRPLLERARAALTARGCMVQLEAV